MLHFTCAESNTANEKNLLFSLICIRKDQVCNLRLLEVLHL